MTQATAAPERRGGAGRASGLVLGAGFALTGAGTIMLGVLLPVVSQKWGLRDDQSGLLFFVQFLGSSLGAIFSGRNRVRSMAVGYGLLVASACALAFAGRESLFVTFFAFGLGLGMAMTSTNLLVSDRAGDERAAKLERLNFEWSFGAMLAPLGLAPFLRGSDLRLMFFTFAGLFLLMFLWVVFRERQGPSVSADTERDGPRAAAARFANVLSLLPLLLLAVCAVGAETALYEWLTTYSHRASPLEFGGGAIATALFMLGVVCSRLIASTRLLAKLGRNGTLRLSLLAVAIALAVLIAAPHRLLIDMAAALAGLGIGPLFPLVLSYLLERSPEGWVLAVSGLGSITFPWVTGVLSAHFGSLRYGLLAPCGAALLMILVSAVGVAPARTTTKI
ncbi:MAG TPA: MFS transporter [Acidobacteriaceae bacterium]|nr:MFS transporter [Acidobacteriaceae bacterium]